MPHDQHAHGGHDHYDHHDHDWEGLADEDHPLWQTDRVVLTTVGIDIGSATYQIVFSVVELRRQGRELASRYAVSSREVVHRSPVRLTPYKDDWIDETVIRSAFEQDYREFGRDPSTVDSGAVILTGEALRRRNAEALAAVLADEAGIFVCVAAGHHMESVLAAHGSGAVSLSRRLGGRVLNVDVGGGTTKFALVERGEFVRTAAVHVGGRLAAFDPDGTLIRLEPAGQAAATAAGFAWRLGDRVPSGEIAAVGGYLADVVSAVVRSDAGPGRGAPWLTEPLDLTGPLDAVVLSGGVAEYAYDSEAVDVGDLGRSLGAGLRAAAASWPAPLMAPTSRIGATVIGASQFSVQVSGNTIYTAPGARLPLRNVPVVRPVIDAPHLVTAPLITEAIDAAIASSDFTGAGRDLVVALPWAGAPSYQHIRALASGVAASQARQASAPDGTLCLVLEQDVSRLLGALLHEEFGFESRLVCIDGVALSNYDFVDVSSVMEASKTVQVTVKSLVYDL
jgi:ethanolamine utilization protein EutA